MSAEFEIEEDVDLECEDDDGNPIAQITLGRIPDEIVLPEFKEKLELIAARIPAEFRDKAAVSIHSYPRGTDVIYERPLTAEEASQTGAAKAAKEKEERHQRYLELKEEFEPEESGLAHEPVNEAA